MKKIVIGALTVVCLFAGCAALKRQFAPKFEAHGEKQYNQCLIYLFN